MQTFAAIALFRALLSRSSKSSFRDEQKTELRDIVRNKFRQHRHEQSKRRLATAFGAGYETLALLRASHSPTSSTSTAATAQLIHLLASTSPTLKAPPIPPPPPKPRGPALSPDSTSILSRPRPTVPGRRRIPFLVNANNFPLLRIKKPQPHQLGAYIRKKADRRMRRHEWREEMGEVLKIAAAEDVWDALVDREIRVRPYNARSTDATEEHDESEERVRWTDAPRAMIKTLATALRDESLAAKALTRQMEGVIEQETALAAKEKEQRRQWWHEHQHEQSDPDARKKTQVGKLCKEAEC